MNFKKILSLVLALALTLTLGLALVSCGDQNNSGNGGNSGGGNGGSNEPVAYTGPQYEMLSDGTYATDSEGNTLSDSVEITTKYIWWQWLIIIFLFGWIWY